MATKDPIEGRLPRGERAGPLFLLALLIGAFIPSVFLSFDLQNLLQDIASAAVAAAEPGPVDLRLVSCASPAGEEGREAVEAPAVFQACPDLAGPARPSPILTLFLADLGARQVAGSHEWPPGPASSPRSPPFTPSTI